MSNRLPLRSSCNGFTLIELLVVVSIISLLIAILLPSLSKARQAVERTQCGSNQRQILTAIHMYCEENADTIFLSYDMTYSTYERSWPARLKRYLNINSDITLASWKYKDVEPIFRCPAVQDILNLNGNLALIPMNRRVQSFRRSEIPQLGDTIMIGDGKPWFWNAAQGWKLDREFGRATTTSYKLSGGRGAIGNIHPRPADWKTNPTTGGANLGFLDGSVRNRNSHNVFADQLNPALQ